MARVVLRTSCPVAGDRWRAGPHSAAAARVPHRSPLSKRKLRRGSRLRSPRFPRNIVASPRSEGPQISLMRSHTAAASASGYGRAAGRGAEPERTPKRGRWSSLPLRGGGGFNLCLNPPMDRVPCRVRWCWDTIGSASGRRLAFYGKGWDSTATTSCRGSELVDTSPT
jgi:hypothetical protein